MREIRASAMGKGQERRKEQEEKKRRRGEQRIKEAKIEKENN